MTVSALSAWLSFKIVIGKLTTPLNNAGIVKVSSTDQLKSVPRPTEEYPEI